MELHDDKLGTSLVALHTLCEVGLTASDTGIELHNADLVTLLERLHDPAIALLGSLVATSFCGLSLGPPLVEVRSLGEQSLLGLGLLGLVLLGLLLGLLHVSLHLLHLLGELGLRGHHLLGAACQLLQGVESTELELQKGLLVEVLVIFVSFSLGCFVVSLGLLEGLVE